ncbi:thioredoxin isoform X1 [Acomys russatus]|uniref:thioredoxin isoform X1 n=1 Tax=Acomys russatus TaxID=60746 RepID=UPI0021E23AD2|nr:thioredoxin isoform X1 [Acomys russatus]
MVKLIESKEAFQEALATAGDKLIVVDFSATWCGPCKMIKPFFHSLCEKYSNVVFLEVDVDDCQVRSEKLDAARCLTVACPLEATLFFKVKRPVMLEVGLCLRRTGHVPVKGLLLDARTYVWYILS